MHRLYLPIIVAVLSSFPLKARGQTADRGSRIRHFAKVWKPIHYQLGGVNPVEHGGIDCSAYARAMYRTLFNVELPRVTRQQVHYGIDIMLNPKNLAEGLRPGDLLFYVNEKGWARHVLVYAGNGLVTHSASGKGVVIEPISVIYGRRVVARRILQ